MRAQNVKKFRVIIERGVDGYFIGRVPALPGCLTQGKTYEELIKNVKEAIEVCLEVSEKDRSYRKQTKHISQPTFVGVEDVAVPV